MELLRRFEEFSCITMQVMVLFHLTSVLKWPIQGRLPPVFGSNIVILLNIYPYPGVICDRNIFQLQVFTLFTLGHLQVIFTLVLPNIFPPPLAQVRTHLLLPRLFTEQSIITFGSVATGVSGEHEIHGLNS